MFDFVFGSKGQAYCLELNGKLVSFCGYFELSEDAFLVISYITDTEYRGMGYGSKCFKAVMDDCKGKKLLINSGTVHIPKWAGWTEIAEKPSNRDQFRTEWKRTVNKRCMDDRDSKLLFLMIISWFQKPNWLQMTLGWNQSENIRSKISTSLQSMIEKYLLMTEHIYWTGLRKSARTFYENSRLIQSRIKPFFLKTSTTFISIDTAGNVNGYISCRKIDCGHSLQPFYADQPETAEKLLRKVIFKWSSWMMIQATILGTDWCETGPSTMVNAISKLPCIPASWKIFWTKL